MPQEEAWQILDFRNEGELWFTECVFYICFILIWYLLIRMLYYFCFSKHAPRFKQFDKRSLKPLQRRAEESRVRRQSEFEAASQSNTNATSATATDASGPQHPQSFARLRGNSKAPNPAPVVDTTEEFQLQICKIHKYLRICFLCSIICTAINVTSVLMNHTLIIAGATGRDCLYTRLPAIANYCQRIALYLFFIIRLHFSFGATQFGIGKVWIIVLVVCVVLFGGIGSFWFFFSYAAAADPCSVGIAGAAGPTLAQDFILNLTLSVLFLSRLRKAIQAQYKGGSVRNLDTAKLKQARKNYKYYYAMYKLTLLFITALLVTITGYIIVAMTELAGAFTAIDSVASNYLLYLTFQFNDLYFRKIYCGCLSLQTKFLGEEYAKEMELHFLVNARKAPHRQSSRTWHEDEDETRTVGRRPTVDTIQEEHDHDSHEHDEENVRSPPAPDSPVSPDNKNDVEVAGNNSKDSKGAPEDSPTPTPLKDVDSQEPMMNRIITGTADTNTTAERHEQDIIEVQDTPQPESKEEEDVDDGDIQYITRADTEVP